MDNCNIFYSILPEGVTGGVGPELGRSSRFKPGKLIQTPASLKKFKKLIKLLNNSQCFKINCLPAISTPPLASVETLASFDNTPPL